MDCRALPGVFIIIVEGALGTTSARLGKRRNSFRLLKRRQMTSYPIEPLLPGGRQTGNWSLPDNFGIARYSLPSHSGPLRPLSNF